jgi:hypothetical protein
MLPQPHNVVWGYRSACKMAKIDRYQKNIAALRRFFPGLDLKIDVAGTAGIVVEKAASGDPTARLNGRYLHSARDPVREARRLAAGVVVSGESYALVLLGFGLGYAAGAAVELSPESLVIVVEKRPEVLRAAFESRDLSALLGKRLVFVLGDDPAAIIAALEIAPKKTVFIKNPALIAADAAFYADVERHIENWRTKETVNQATLRRFGKRWIRNQAKNLPYIRDLPGIKQLSGLFDFPALLLAAGPSLNGLRGKLKPLAERCIVVAVDTALRFLRDEGVTPDFVVSVDPQYWNTRHLDRCLPEKSVLIAESAVYPGALRNRPPESRAFLCGSLYPLGSFIEKYVGDKGRLGAGGSVASTAWDFAVSLVCRAAHPSIYIAGLDLAFPEFATHYKGALFEENSHVTATRFLPAETNSFHALRDGVPFFAESADGNRVLTDKRLNLYASWFENQMLNRKNINNFRISGMGLAIKGLKTVDTDEILALPPCRPAILELFKQIMDRIFREWNDKTEKEARTARYQAAQGALLDGLEAILNITQPILRDIQEFERLNASTNLNKRGALLKKINDANNAVLKSDVKPIAGFLFPDIDTAAGPGTADFNQYMAFTKKVYTEINDGIEFTLSAVKNTPLN